MSACPELSLMYPHYNTEQQALDTLSQHHLHQSIPSMKPLPPRSSLNYQNNREEFSNSRRSDYVTQSMYHMNTPPIYDQQQQQQQQYSTKDFHYRMLSPPLSTVSSSSSSSIQKPSLSPPQTTNNNNTSLSTNRCSTQSPWNITWLVFMNEKWVPFDVTNQVKLEQTMTVGGTFVDISDSHFPGVKRVRVFPRSYYLSYLGVKYRLSRVMQPDAYLDHVGVAQIKQLKEQQQKQQQQQQHQQQQQQQQQMLKPPLSEDDNRLKNRVWEM